MAQKRAGKIHPKIGGFFPPQNFFSPLFSPFFTTSKLRDENSLKTLGFLFSL
jgi:hypothetical protein